MATYEPFTKLAVSRLIMVRFEKLKIWHAQDFDPDLANITEALRDVTKTLRDVTRTRTSSMTSQSLPSLNLNLVAASLLGGPISETA